jgi:mono/diheme cytochrome c family protein
MKARAAAAGCVLLLGACGGGVSEPVAPQPLGAVTLASVATAPDYELAAQRLYLAYLGRPAEPAGLAFFAGVLRQDGLPGDPGALLAAYGGDPRVRALLDSLEASAEARELYPAADADRLDALYRNLFNRDADGPGKAWWSEALARGTLTRAQLPLALLAAARGADPAVFDNKLALAAAFTAALDTPARAAAYQGAEATAMARQMLAQVAAATAPAAYAPLVDAVLAELAGAARFSQVQAIVRNRCVACHSVHPTMPGFSAAPRGIRFDSAEQIRADAARIYYNVVQTEFMPYGNRTGMTGAERALVGAWYEAGAR